MNRCGNNDTFTIWYEKAKAGETWKEYPRPSMVRKNWINLNGLWDVAVTGTEKEPEMYDEKIMVPFSPESACSGLRRTVGPEDFLWYHRKLVFDDTERNYLLHFGAADQICRVYLDGKEVCSHTGGYLPFEVLIRPEKPEYDLTVRVQDTTDTSWHSRGKQKLKPSGMFYTCQSGLWKSVWMEPVPENYIEKVDICPYPENGSVCAKITVSGSEQSCMQPEIFIRKELPEDYRYRTDPEIAELPADQDILVFGKGKRCRLSLPEFTCWDTENPVLYHLTVKTDSDRVECYFAMRSLQKITDGRGLLRFGMNHRICMQTGVLDQGYWPESLMTPPSEDAMINDIISMKNLGFNMIRKHIKIEPERWYYHCDRLGMLVWQDMVNGGTNYKSWFVTYLATVMNIRHIHFPDGFGTRHLLSRTSLNGRKEYISELKEMIGHLKCHPSIICWVPFNESWGQFNASETAEYVKKLDQTRFVDHASGWFDQKAGDVCSLHYYFFRLHFQPEKNRVCALSEFGGYSWIAPGHEFSRKHWGYGHYENSRDLSGAYRKLMEEKILPACREGISALVYTQISDVEEEPNGILTYDRKLLKIDGDILKEMNRLFLNTEV